MAEYDDADLEARISAVIATKLFDQQKLHDKAIADLRAELEAERRAREVAVSALPASERVPMHGAGHGTEVAETWSQWQQSQSARDKTSHDVALEELANRVLALEQLSAVRAEA